MQEGSEAKIVIIFYYTNMQIKIVWNGWWCPDEIQADREL